MLFNRDLRDFGRSSENEVGVIDSIVLTVRHVDDERLKRGSAQELSDPGFHT